METTDLTLECMVRELEEISFIDGIDPDLPLGDLSIDSLRILEWVYAIEDLSGVSMEEQYGDLADLDVEQLTIRRLHSHIESQLSGGN